MAGCLSEALAARLLLPACRRSSLPPACWRALKLLLDIDVI